MNQTPKVSPHTALALLLLFKQRRLELDERQYEECVDTIVELLEQVNDESYRLTKNPRIIIPETTQKG